MVVGGVVSGRVQAGTVEKRRVQQFVELDRGIWAIELICSVVGTYHLMKL